MDKILEEVKTNEEKYRVGYRNMVIPKSAYVDDMVICFKNETTLQCNIQVPMESSMTKNNKIIKVNPGKTKTMIIGKDQEKIMINIECRE